MLGLHLGPWTNRRASIRLMARNPPWTIDEVILALSLYFERGLLDDTDATVIELSGVMNALPMNVGSDHEATLLATYSTA